MWPEIPYLVDDLDGLWELSVERCVLEKGPLVDVPKWTIFQRVLAVVNCHRTLLWDACKVQKVCNHPRNYRCVTQTLAPVTDIFCFVAKPKKI